MENKIAELTSTKSQLEADIIRIKGKPKYFSAGYYTAGSDFETGPLLLCTTKLLSPLDLRVNTILGGGSYGVDEYIYTFSTGDEIDANSSFWMVLIE